MTGLIRIEDIYDAAIDDGLFDALPALLAQQLGARSGVLHWHEIGRSDLGEIRHSHHFTEYQLACLDPSLDIWSEASRRVTNHAVRCNDLITEAAYANSRIYNEWVVAIGDDSFHALGATVTIGSVEAEFGFHRARSVDAFDNAALDSLDMVLAALRRLVSFRARIAGTGARALALETALDASGDAVFVLDESGRPLHANRAAEALLIDSTLLTTSAGRLRGVDAHDDRSWQTALRAAFARDGACGSTLKMGDRSEGASSIASLLPTMIVDQRRVIAVIASSRREPDRARRFGALHGLSAAESDIAILLADAHSPADIAERRGTSLMTVRSQIKTILGKTGCARQADLGAAVHALPRLAAPAD